MRERKYSVAEIDEMRRLVETEYLFGRYSLKPDRWYISYKSKTETSKVVEERLRTYMLAGIGPDELVGEATS